MLWYTIWFCVIFVGFFILRGIAATWVFLILLPQGDRCPCCDEPTLRLQSGWWNRVVPGLRSSWCYQCGWEGLLRNGPATPVVEPRTTVRSGRQT
jgi:hypothetical protein